MIFSIEGTLQLKALSYIVVEANGVGYRVRVGTETLKNLPAQGEKAKIFTSLYQRENDIELYGFLNIAEMEFFEVLNNISGIGPKSALGILNVAPLDTLKRAIAGGQIEYLTKVSGIGKKTAQRVIIELKEKLGASGGGEEFGEDEDVMRALQALGYSLKEARDAIHALPKDIQGAEKRIKEALKIVGRGS
ncbi:MAG: Holliday junction branch migration protein RuvA [bacterium]|nr:Holliday junction branch migration protein RuvA [bacterium]